MRTTLERVGGRWLRRGGMVRAGDWGRGWGTPVSEFCKSYQAYLDIISRFSVPGGTEAPCVIYAEPD
eukprot:71741-Pyramimonas_sp.AAC.1